MEQEEAPVQFLDKTRLRPVFMIMAEAGEFDLPRSGVKSGSDAEFLLSSEHG